MLEKRTDLAIETHEINAESGKDDGIILKEYVKNGFNVTEATVKEGEGEKLSGKAAGKYVTVDIGRVWQTDSKKCENAVNAVAAELSALIPDGEGSVLTVGLGNEEITPDSIGPKAVKSLIVTRHLKSAATQLYKSAGFGDLAAVAPGVLGQTGIESADVISGICREIKPKCVILIDALASRRLTRLATTVQISDNGISPGSGVLNKRAELNSKKLSIPVISLGIPMVVDAATLAYDLLQENMPQSADGSELEKAVNALMHGSGKTMFVSPKDADVITKELAKLVANAVNLAVHGITPAEALEYIS